MKEPTHFQEAKHATCAAHDNLCCLNLLIVHQQQAGCTNSGKWKIQTGTECIHLSVSCSGYPQCQPFRGLHWSSLLPQQLHLRVELVGSQRQTLQHARCSCNMLRIGMQEPVEVDRIGQRLCTYSIGHKQGIHPAKSVSLGTCI